MEIKNFIWDFDGTLFDTYGAILQALTQTLAEANLKFDRNELYRLVKRESVGFTTDYFGQLYGLSGEKLNKRYHEIEHQLQHEPKPYTGTKNILNMVVEKGKQNFLYTHRDDKVFDFLDQFQLKTVFTGAVTSDNDFPRKPDPSALQYLVGTYHLDPEETIMIGDRAIDIKAGKNAGVHTLYFDVDQFHDDAGADVVVSELIEIETLI